MFAFIGRIFGGTVSSALTPLLVAALAGLSLYSTKQYVEISTLTSTLSTEREAASRAALEAERRINEFRTSVLERQEKAKLEAASRAAEMEAALASSRDSHQRLLRELARQKRAEPRATEIAASGSVGQTTGDSTGVLTNVLGECVTAVRKMAETADRRGAAGQTCEAQYDALTDSQQRTLP